MDFEEHDKVYGDTLQKGDIVLNEYDDYLQLGKVQDDEDSLITFPAENLTSPDGEDFFIAIPEHSYTIYRSY